jgi:hypothetical protein
MPPGGGDPTPPGTGDVPDPPPTGPWTDDDPDTSGDDCPGGECLDLGVPGGPCDMWSENCPSGYKCMPWANDGGSTWNATKCSPLHPDPKGPGERCTVEGNAVSGIDDCAKHSMCWNVDPETNEGTCVAFCVGSLDAPSCADECSGCVIANDGILILCLPRCDPVLQDCPAGQGCYPVQDDFACVPDASDPDGGGYGDPCEYINACDPGLACINADSLPNCVGSVGCCSPFCVPPSQCPDENLGMECVDWFEDTPPLPCVGEIGICRLPV